NRPVRGICAPRGEPVTTSEREVVAALGQAIAQRIGEPRYRLWFDQHTKFAWDDGQLVVGVPNHFFQEWLQNTFAEALRAAASAGLAGPMQVRFAIDPELFQKARQAQEEVRRTMGLVPGHPLPPEEPGLPQAEPPGPAPKAAVVPKRSRRWHRLADFVVGA